MTDIVQLDQLLKDYLVSGKKIVEYSTENLTEPGENFGSRILAVEVQIEDEEKGEESLYLAAKMYPLNPLIEKIFNSSITFKKEIGLYTIIAEELKKLQDEHDLNGLIDFFPKYYGGRLSLEQEATVGDAEALFLLENLKKSNYVSVDRLEGFNLKTAQLIIKKLAIFHSSTIVLKLKKPEIFKDKIVPLLERALGVGKSPIDASDKFIMDNLTNHLTTIMGKDEFLKEHIEKVRPYFEQKPQLYGSEEVREPFMTIGHNDGWVNNILVLFENKEPVQVKLVDFQGIDYGSPVRDLIFFLFTSVQTSVLRQNIDHLIDFYFKAFVETLDKFDIDQEHHIFTRDQFEKEIQIEGKYQFIHISFILTAILRKRGTVKPLGEMQKDDFAFNPKNMGEEFEPKILYTTSEFIKRNWFD